MYTLKEIRREEAAQNPEAFLIESLIGKVRAYRIFFGISQRELSRISGVTQNIISRMENGLITPHIQTIFKLLNALDLDIEINVQPRKNERDELNLDKQDEMKIYKNRIKKISLDDEESSDIDS